MSAAIASRESLYLESLDSAAHHWVSVHALVYICWDKQEDKSNLSLEMSAAAAFCEPFNLTVDCVAQPLHGCCFGRSVLGWINTLECGKSVASVPCAT